MRTRLRSLLAVGFFTVWSAGVAHAQTAQFTGTVKDASGGVIPGVSVTAKNQETGLQRTAVTESTGAYRLPALPPGPYTVTAEVSGFATEVRSGIVLIIDQTATINFALKLANVAETLTVTGEAPIVDTTRSDVGTIIIAKQTDELPIATRRWVDFAMLTPGASQDAIRGGPYRGSINIGSGTRFYSSMFLVDGVNNTWVQQGESRQNYGADAIREFKVSTSNFKAELGLATGGVLSVVTKSGTNDFRGNGFVFFRNADLTQIEKFQQTKPPNSREQYGGSIGGPIVHDRTHFFFTYERTDQKIYTTVSTSGIWPEYEGTYLSKQYVQLDTTRVDHQLTAKQSIFGRYSAERDKRPYSTVGVTTPPNSSNDRAKPSNSLVLGHTWILSDHALNEIRFQRAYAKFVKTAPGSLLSPEGGDFTPGDFGPVRLAQLRPVFAYPSIRIGLDDTEMGEELRYEIKNDFAFTVPSFGGNHQWKGGVDYNYVNFWHDATSGYLGTWTFPKDQPYNPNDRTTWPTQYTQSLPRYSETPAHTIGAYVQDDWSPTSRLVFNLGLRYDLQTGVFQENLQDNLARIGAALGPQFAQFPMPVPFIDTSVRGDKNNFGPRVGVAFDPTGGGATSVHAGFGMFYDNFRSLGPTSELTWPQGQQIIVRNPNFPDALGGLSRTQFLSTAAPNINVNDNRLVNPYAHHYTAGLTQKITRDIGLSVDMMVVKRYSDVDTIDLNLPDQVTKIKPYPQFGRVSSIVATSNNDYKALLVKLEKRLAHHYQFLTSYTLAKAQDSPLTNRLSDRYGYVRVENSPAAADRRHRLVASAIVELPHEMQVSLIGDYRSKLSFNPTTTLDINGDGYTGDLPPGVLPQTGCRDLNLAAVNTFRTGRGLAAVSEDGIACPSYMNLDLRFNKGFMIAKQHRIEAIVQLLNVFNRAQLDVAQSSLQSAAFGQAQGLIPFIVNAPSRQLEFAMRYQF